MNLYEIDSNIEQLVLDAVDPETGEINEEAYERLDAMQMERYKKIENILLWIKNLRAEAEALKAEKKSFADRQAAAEKKAESLTQYISGVLHGEKYKTDRVAVSWRKSETVEYTGDAKTLPAALVRTKYEADKTAIKDALKAGLMVPDAKLVVRQNIQIK